MTVVVQRSERQDDGSNQKRAAPSSSSAVLRSAARAQARRSSGSPDWLAALQRATVEHAVSRSGEPFVVVLYALTTAGRQPTASLERARMYAAEKGWRIAGAAFDDCGMTEPNERPAWNQALRLLRGARAQGIVTVDRSSVSTNDTEYEQALLWLQDRRSFLEHVPIDWHPSPIT